MTLSPFAMLAENTRGRKYPREKCPIRTDYQCDRDKIIHSKAFRRLKHKTQVFVAPEGDHFRTRLTHTLEVAQIARTVARALRLNEDLTEAMALGHDIGHTPFGHAGERALSEICPGGFKHNMQSLRVCELLENGSGLNLTAEVLELFFAALEAVAVMVADDVGEGGLLDSALHADEVVEAFVALGMLGCLPAREHDDKLVGDAH